MSYNFTTVMGGSSSYKAWKKWNEGEYLAGKFISQGVDSFGNPNYKVEVIDTNFEEDAPKVGTIFTFNSSGSLKVAMEEVEKGDAVKVIYKGLAIKTKGKFKGKEYHDMEIMVGKPTGTQTKVTEEDSDELI